MKIFVAPIVIGLLALAGAAPAAAQSTPEKGTSLGRPQPTTDDPAAERNNFTNHAQGEMNAWEQKLHDYIAKQKTNATQAETSASRNLDSAWTETKTAWTWRFTRRADGGNLGRS